MLGRTRYEQPRDPPPTSPQLERELVATVDGEVRFDVGSRALYATDGSNYRQVPIGVVVPRTIDAVIATVAACRVHGAPVLPRGGGTSLCGQCCNVAVVLDFSKYLNRIVELDPRRQGRVRRAGLRARHAARRGRAAPPDVRARSVDAQPQHARRHDRQQFLRRAFGDGRQDRRQRHRARRADVRRAALHGEEARRRAAATAERRRRMAVRSTASTGACRRCAIGTPTRSARAFRRFRAACPATRSTSCCRKTASTSRARSSAPKAPA